MSNFTKIICIISLIASTCLGIVAYISIGKIEPNFKKIKPLFDIQTELALHHSHAVDHNYDVSSHIKHILIDIQKLIDLTNIDDVLLKSILNDIEHGDPKNVDAKIIQFKEKFQVMVYEESNRETNVVLWILCFGTMLNVIIATLIIRKNKEHDVDIADKLANIDRLEMYTSLTGSIAHEFRNILTVILGYSEMILIGNKCKYNKEIITIRDLCHRATDLIAQLYHSNTSLCCTDVNISDVLLDTISMLRKTNKNLKITCYFNRSKDLCNTNKQYLEQIFLNILTNAIHAVTTKHTGEIHIEAMQTIDDYIIEIHDTGIGISDENLEKIFELFYTTKGTKGTGLGLAVTSNLIKKLNGSIHVENKDWTTFTITIPR